MTGELTFDCTKIFADRLEQLREGGDGWFLRGGIQVVRSHHIEAECQRAVRPNSCSRLELRDKQATEVLSRCFRNRLSTGVSKLRDDFGDANNPRRLVAGASMRNRRQKRAVGLDEQAIEGNHARHFLQL